MDYMIKLQEYKSRIKQDPEKWVWIKPKGHNENGELVIMAHLMINPYILHSVKKIYRKSANILFNSVVFCFGFYLIHIKYQLVIIKLAVFIDWRSVCFTVCACNKLKRSLT